MQSGHMTTLETAFGCLLHMPKAAGDEPWQRLWTTVLSSYHVEALLGF